jgi:hypothetical protein
VHDYYAAVNRTIQTGDISAIEKRFLPSCSLCAKEVAAYRGVFGVGNSIKGGLIVVNSAVAGGVGDSNVIPVLTSITEAPTSIVDSKGKVLKTYPSSTNPNLLFEIKVTTSGKLTVAAIDQATSQ